MFPIAQVKEFIEEIYIGMVLLCYKYKPCSALQNNAKLFSKIVEIIYTCTTSA